MTRGKRGSTEGRLSDPSSDRWVVWPLLVTLGVPTALVVRRATPLGPDFWYVILGIPGLLLVWATVALYAMVRAIISVRRATWRTAASMAVLPAVVLALAPVPATVLRGCHLVGDLIHFEMMRSQYSAAVKAMPSTGQPKLAVFNWGGMLWASTGVVYDESDEVVLPPAQQTPAWQLRAANTDLSCDGYITHSLGNHFYLASFRC